MLCWQLAMSALRQADGREKRGAPRYRVLSQATVIARGTKHFCVVRDLSETGAKLGVSEQCKLPGQYQAMIPVFVGPAADIRERAAPVDAGVGPELDEHDFSAQGRRCQG